MFFLLPLLMYFPRLLPGVETQPFMMLAASLWFLCFSRNTRPRFFLLLMLGAMLMLCALRVSAGLGAANSLLLIQLLIGPLFFFGAAAATGNTALPSLPLLRAVTLLFVLLAVIEIVVPTLYLAVASTLLDRATITDGHRGVSFLTPEPTYAAISLVYLLLLTIWVRKPDQRQYRWLEPLQFLLLAATLSTYAVLIIAILLAAWRPRIAMLALLAMLLIFPSLSLFSEGEGALRFVVAISSVLATDFSTFLPSLSLLDPSLGSRVLTNSASFQTPGFAPLGLGMGCEAVPSAFEQLGYNFAFSNEVLAQVIAGGCVKPQSYGAALFLGLGYLALPFMALLAMAMYASVPGRRDMRVWKVTLVLAVLMLLVQAQLTNPIPWMLLFFAVTRFARPPQACAAQAALAPAPQP